MSYRLSGDAGAERDYAALAGSVTIPAGEHSATVQVKPLKTAADDRTAIVTLDAGANDYYLGCPAQSLIVIRR